MLAINQQLFSMTDIIQLLPDSIANQIAAGEVIQRPASVVKELMENAIDAGSTSVKVIIKDAGKTLVQVIDDGKGMSDTDARMCFERHATSKIRKAEDLFKITTKGFRGEALASIAAIAHVELITKKHDEELGRRLLVAGSKVTKHEPCQCPSGTSFSVKNLFFNVPARRKFLKSDAVELRHILEEFKRIVLAHPDVFFSLYHNEQEVYHLPKGNYRQRIVGVMGKAINEKLVPVAEDTEVISISGFVGKPEAAKKTKGGQYIFVNDRYIKSNYLNHAIRMAYGDLIPKESYPFYALYLVVDPDKIDINVHPTKTEIKFDDERLIYNFLRVAIKHSLGFYNVSPSLDFEQNPNFGTRVQSGRVLPGVNREYHMGAGQGANTNSSDELRKENIRSWESLMSGLKQHSPSQETTSQSSFIVPSKIRVDQGQDASPVEDGKPPVQLHNKYILCQIKSGFILIDQQAAHERILYEQNLKSLESHQRLVQKELFPRALDLDNAKATIFKEILPQINALGFEIEYFGNKSFVLHGMPAELSGSIDAVHLIEKLLDNYISNIELQMGIDENIARSMAETAAIKRGKILSDDEMKKIVDKLFLCDIPYLSPSGKKCIVTMDINTIDKKFQE